MQRLACVTFARRLCSAALVSAAASQTNVRFSSDDNKYVNKVAKKKVDMGEDERWLEAELDENINTPEERFARALEVERLRKLMEQLDAKHSEKIDVAVRERESQVESLKKQVAEMQSKIEELSKRK